MFIHIKIVVYVTVSRKNHSTQRALVKMVETWKSNQILGNKIGVLLVDLPKAFDSINHE